MARSGNGGVFETAGGLLLGLVVITVTGTKPPADEFGGTPDGFPGAEPDAARLLSQGHRQSQIARRCRGLCALPRRQLLCLGRQQSLRRAGHLQGGPQAMVRPPEADL